MTEELLTMILISVGIVLLVVLIFVAIEIIRTVRTVRVSVDELMPAVNETVTRVNSAMTSLEPSFKRVEPLIERASLTVDAVNLEIMRVDQILSDISDVTDVASGTVKRVTGIAEAPLNLLTSATDKIRSVFSDRKSEKQTQKALAQGGANDADVQAAIKDAVSKDAAAKIAADSAKQASANGAKRFKIPVLSKDDTDMDAVKDAATNASLGTQYDLDELVDMSDATLTGKSDKLQPAATSDSNESFGEAAKATKDITSLESAAAATVAQAAAQAEAVMQAEAVAQADLAKAAAQASASRVQNDSQFSAQNSAKQKPMPPRGMASSPPPAISRVTL